MRARPTRPAAADQATNNPTTPLPTPPTADHVTAREITQLLRHLTELRASAHPGDPAQQAAFLTRKADLLTRIAAQHARTPATPPPPTTPEGRTP